MIKLPLDQSANLIPLPLDLLLSFILTARFLPACAQLCAPGSTGTSPTAAPSTAPVFRGDPACPKPLATTKESAQQIVGQVAGIVVNPRNDYIRTVHRPVSPLPDKFDPKTKEPVTRRLCRAMR